MHTFLFTDIADHTALWEANAQGMSIALADCEQILEDAAVASRWLAAANAVGGVFTTPEGWALYRQWMPRVRSALDAETAAAQRAAGSRLDLAAVLQETTGWIAAAPG